MAPRRFSNFRRASTASAFLAAGLWVVYTFPPAASRFYPRCVFHAVTGLDCPGCGSTRALHQLLHGHFLEAARFNALLYVLIAVTLCAAPSLWRGETPRFMTRPWFAWTTVVVLVSWWVVRNLPLYAPFSATG